MNGLLLLAIAAALLLTAYLVYGRYLVKTWGIDPKAKHLLMKRKMELIMFQVTNGKYLDTNSHQLLELVQ